MVFFVLFVPFVVKEFSPKAVPGGILPPLFISTA
jgi:hypothetical protein